MKYEFSKNSNERFLHIRFIPQNIDDQKVFNEDYGDLVNAHINEAVLQRLGNGFKATQMSRIEKYEYQVSVQEKV